ncbi:hypothetical protein H5410_043714 [Solanum commersonii]|uniref:Uncharacterized protein n=1 Tax=Solanum commersonii TaxID=4109 RepID=A0A9J5Y104_SOLCO|nr:hypothetical protein H5410_043714 [Solanum commersonii]
MTVPSKTEKTIIVLALRAPNAPRSTVSKAKKTSMPHEKHQVVETMSSTSAELSGCGYKKKPTPWPFYPSNIQHRASSQNQEPCGKQLPIPILFYFQFKDLTNLIYQTELHDT